MLLKFCGKARYMSIWCCKKHPSQKHLVILAATFNTEIKIAKNNWATAKKELNRMLTTFLRRYWIKQQPKLSLPDTLIISFILCSLSGLFSVCRCCDCTCSFIPPFVLNCFEQCWSCSINIVNTGAIVLIYHVVFVIRMYASNVNRGPGFTKRISPSKWRRIDHWVTVFLFQKIWSKKKKQKKRSRE